MNKTSLLIGLVLMMALTAGNANAENCLSLYTECTGSLEGNYTSIYLPDQSFTLKADVVATFDNDIKIQNIDTTGSVPAINDSTLAVTAVYNETSGLIEVTATGTCGMENDFDGYMEIDPCSHEVVYTEGYVTPPTGQMIPLEGDFTISVQCQEIPEFPTVALPMIAIIGLAFFIQRRKD